MDDRDGAGRSRLGAWLRVRVWGAVLATSAAGLAACVDLFHSTDFGTCASDGGAGCLTPEGGAVDAVHDTRSRPTDAGHDARDATTHVDAKADAGVDAAKGPPDGTRADAPHHDANEASVPHDAGHDAERDAPPPVDSGTNFCAWDTATATAHAVHACLWLGACAAPEDLNEYGTCYPNALMAYDCNLNPNQRVHGTLHTYWDRLWQATSCDDVMAAIFPGGSGECPLYDGGFGCAGPADAAAPTVAVGCAPGGVWYYAVNCAMQGYTCRGGACSIVGDAGCTAASGVQCDTATNTFHSCQLLDVDGGTTPVLVDVGRNCTNFGAGRCVAVEDGGGGCVPEEAGSSCHPSPLAVCGGTGGASAIGCATGVTETIRCPDFGFNDTCTIAGERFGSSNQLVLGCFNATTSTDIQDTCENEAQLEDYAGPAGGFVVSCADAGLDACAVSSLNGRPYCGLQ